jgi:hypothetical protein
VAQLLVSDPTLTNGRQNLADLLKARSTQLSALNERFWTVIGSGSVGAKAEELMKKTWAMEQAGFVLHSRVVLAMGFFEEFIKRNGLSEELKRQDETEFYRRVENAVFSDDEIAVLRSMIKKFEGKYLAVRSSTHGDTGEGHGIYYSGFVGSMEEEKMLKELMRQVSQVIASDYWDDAIALRERTGIAPGVAIIIEPVLDQGFENDSWRKLVGPVYSGTAYATTDGKSGNIFIYPGSDAYAMRDSKYFLKISELDSGPLGYLEAVEDLRRTHRRENDIRLGSVSVFCSSSDRIATTSIDYWSPLMHRPMEWFFSKLRKYAQLCGCEQKIEWGLIERNGEPEITIFQTCDLPLPKSNILVIPNENTRAEAVYVSASGIIEGRGLVFVNLPEDAEALKEFNKTHTGYGVVITDFMLTNAREGERMTLAHWHNAPFIMEIPRGRSFYHNDSPEIHTAGMLAAVGQVFMMCTESEDDERLDRFRHGYEPLKVTDADGKDHYVRYLDVKFRVTANQEFQRGIVDILE